MSATQKHKVQAFTEAISSYKSDKKVGGVLNIRYIGTMKIIKILGMVVLFSIIFVASFLLYYGRSQTIDFMSMIEDEIEICNQTIYKNDKKFIQLSDWLKKNQTGWKQYPATQAVGYVYNKKNIVINVGKGWVVVNYGEGKEASQVILSADTTRINGQCK